MILYQVFKAGNNGWPEYSSVSRNNCSNFIMDNMIPFDPSEFCIHESVINDPEFKDIEFKDDVTEYDYNYLFPFSVKYDAYFDRLEICFGEKLYKTKLPSGSKRLKFLLSRKMFERYEKIPGYYVISKESFESSTSSDTEHEVEEIVSEYVLSEYVRAVQDVMITDMDHTYRNHITVSDDC